MIVPRLSLALGLLLLWLAPAARGASVTAVWQGGAGNWTDAPRWSTSILPHNTGSDSFDVQIDGGNAAASEVTLDSEEIISTLHMDANDSLLVTATGRLTLEGSALENSGRIVLSGPSGAFPSSLAVNASGTALSGGGVVELDGGGISGFVGGQSLTNVDNRIEGWGEIHIQGFRGFVNQGVIEADVAGKTLSIIGGANEGTVRAVGGASAAFDLSGQGFFNSGTVEIFDGSSFAQADTTSSVGGSYSAMRNSSMLLAGSFDGTHLATDDTSLIRFSGGQDTGLKDVTLEGQFAGDEIFVSGTITNRGVFRGAIDPLGPTTIANEGHMLLQYSVAPQADGVLSFTGGGSVEIDTGGGVNGLFAPIRNLDNQMRGKGSFGALKQNGGLIEAVGGVLYVAPSQLDHSGVFAAAPTGVLEMDSMVSGTGSWRADGGVIHVTGNVNTTGDIAVVHGGSLVVETQMTGDNLLVDDTGKLDVRGVLRIAGDLDFDGANGGRWSFANGAFFEASGGVGAAIGDWSDWQSLEAAGRDLGLIAAGFASGNFYLPRLVIGDDGHLFLKDSRENGNHVGADPEVVYVDTLVFSDSLGLLNLNGIKLYYNQLVGSPSQIIDLQVVPEPSAASLLALSLIGLLALSRRK